MYLDLAPHAPSSIIDLATGNDAPFQRSGEFALYFEPAEHEHGVAICMGRSVLCVVSTTGDVHSPAPATSAAVPWLFDGALGKLVLRGSSAQMLWSTVPIMYAPEMRVVLQRALEILDATHLALCARTARAFAWQCLLVAMRAHCTCAPEVPDFLRLLRDVAEHCDALCDALPAQYGASCRALFGPSTLMTHRPRAGAVRLRTGALRDVVVLTTQVQIEDKFAKVLELVDTESAALIVPTKPAADALLAQDSTAVVYSFADARTVYDAVVWYGDRACVLGGDLARLGVPPYRATNLSVVARGKNKHQLSTGRSYLISEHDVSCYVKGCTQNVRGLSEAQQRDGARAWERSALARCPFAVPTSTATLRRALWCLALRGKEAFRPPAARLANRLVANLNTSVAHKVVELCRELGVRSPTEIAESCSVLADMCALSMAGEVRLVVGKRLQSAKDKLASDPPSEGGALAALVLLALFLHEYI